MRSKHSRWLLNTLALLAAAWPAWAFEGRVLRGDQPVAGAEVSILGQTGLARTDADGRFRWPAAVRAPFEALVLLPGGGHPKPIHVATLPAEGPLLLALELEFEEAVTVTAGSAPHLESTPGSGTTLLSSRDVEVRLPAVLAQALENVAGISTVSEGQAAVPAIRGLANGRALILIDGARVSAERRVGASATYLDPAVLEGIEVSRGPGGVAYGSDAFGGVIDARTRGAAPGSGWGGRFVGALGAGVPEQRASLELTRGHADGGVLVQGHWRDFEDYESPAGPVENSGASDYGFRARVDQRLGPGNLRLGWQGDMGRDVERPRTNSGTVRFYYPSEDSHRFTTSWEAVGLGSWSRVGASAFLGSYAVVTDQDRYATATRPRSIERADVSSQDFHVRVFGERPWGGAQVEAGLDVNGRFGLEALEERVAYDAAGAVASSETIVSVEDARRTDSGLYLKVSGAPTARLELAGGLRGDYVATRNQGGYFGDRSTSNAAASGFAAATLGPFGGFRLTAQASRGFRDPVLSDRYYRGPTGRGFITGEPDLAPETSAQLDLALRYTARRWRVAAYAYQYRFDDLIERYQEQTDFFFYRNRGRARIRGVELELQAEPAPGLSLELSGHVLEGLALDDDTPLDNIPPATLTLRVTQHVGRGFLQARAGLYGADDEPGPTEQARAAHQLLELAGGLRLTRQVELRLVARNVLDEEYLVSPDSRSPLAPGRSLLGAVTIAF